MTEPSAPQEAQPSPEVVEAVAALKQAEAFIGVMFGVGPDAIIPDNVTSPIGVNIFLGGIMRDIRAAIAAYQKATGGAARGEAMASDRIDTAPETIEAVCRAIRIHKGEWLELRPATLRAILDDRDCLRAALASARREALEEAAKIAEDPNGAVISAACWNEARLAKLDVASRIRALIDGEKHD